MIKRYYCKKMKNKIRLIRHATLLLTINDLNILVDPMLSAKNAMDPVPNASNTSRIPMADLPISESELKTMLTKIDASFDYAYTS